MKQPPAGTEQRIAQMSFSSLYPLYLAKVEKKGRTQEELNRVITWLTGYSDKRLAQLVSGDGNLESFFSDCELNPNAHLITGLICGYRVEELENDLIRQARYMDKLVDELAKGKGLEKILRSSA